MALTAILLAGGPPDAVAELEPGAPNKAFVPIHGVTLAERTLRALRSSEAIGRIIAVAPPGAHAHPGLVLAGECRADGPRIADSLRSGLAGLDPDESVVVAASDLPVLSRAAVDEFIGRALARDCDVTYSCLERSVHEAAYPDVPHTWAKMADGSFCGGGLVTLKPRVFGSLERFLDRLGSARKNPLALASIFGAEVMFRYAVGSLSIADAERRASELLGAPAAAIACSHAEIAFNVDRPGDVALAERYAVASDPTASG